MHETSRLPVKSGVVIVVLLILGFALYFMRVVRKTEVPQRLPICQLHQGKQETTFICPKGDHFDFTIGVPPTQKLPPKISGKLLLKCESNSPPELAFDTENSTHGNWLQGEHLEAYIINWPTGAPVGLQEQLIGGRPVRISIDVTSPLEGSASLWLNYLAQP